MTNLEETVARNAESVDLLKCSFCGKSQKQVKKLIAGPGVYICDECIELCNEIVDEELGDSGAGVPLELPKPREIFDFLEEYMAHEEVGTIVLGKPTRMDATPSATWVEIQALSQRLQQRFPSVRLEYVDERFTSVLAQQAIRQAGIGKQRRQQDKGLVDRISATIILQSYLESLQMLR